MKNPTNQISSVVLPLIIPPSILFIICLSTSTSSNIELEVWKFPCSNGKNDTAVIPDEVLMKLGDLVAENKDSPVKMVYSTVAMKVTLLEQRLKILIDEYFESRFPGDNREIYEGISIDVIPHFRKYHDANLINDEELVDEVYENFARFSIYLFFAVAGEEKEKFRIRFSDKFRLIHNNQDYGVGTILCNLSFLTKFFGSDDKLIVKLDKLELDSMSRYMGAKDFQRHLMDYLILRQFKENLARISKYFILRSATYDDDGQKPFHEVVKGRVERHVSLGKSRVEEREDEISNVQLDNLEKILTAKRERVRPRRKNRPSRRISRDQREYDLLMRMI